MYWILWLERFYISFSLIALNLSYATPLLISYMLLVSTLKFPANYILIFNYSYQTAPFFSKQSVFFLLLAKDRFGCNIHVIGENNTLF